MIVSVILLIMYSDVFISYFMCIVGTSAYFACGVLQNVIQMVKQGVPVAPLPLIYVEVKGLFPSVPAQ